MENIGKGEVSVVLDGVEYILKPSLNAFQMLGTRYESYGELLRLVSHSNVAAIETVLRFGLGFSDREAKRLLELIFRTGVGPLIEPVSDYVFRLYNNGSSASEVLEQQTAPESPQTA